jgi:REP element-mobilizing transposase RayT
MGDSLILSDVENSILENNIYGVDLNDESVEIAKLSLWLRTAQKGRKLNSLNNNIKCGNSLIDDPEVAGEKAFSWEIEFPEVFKEKNKFAFHITTALHDSRTSDRMVKYKARERRFEGTKPDPEVFPMTKEEEELIASTVADIVREDKLNIAAFNLCWDHMHILLVCEEEDVPKIMHKIKGRTARACNMLRNKGINPLDVLHKDGSTPFWTQKYGCKPVTTEEHFWNTYNYIENNKVKHDLPKNPKLEKIIFGFVKTYEDCFRTEYSGGFDVVIGNPPYGAKLDSKDWLKIKYYETSFGNIDSYKYFVQLGISCVKDNGALSYIMPDSYLEKEYFKDLRIFVSNNFEKVRNLKLGDDIFEEVNLPTAIIILHKKGEVAKIFEYSDLSSDSKQEKKQLLFDNPKFNNIIPEVEKTFIVIESIIKCKKTKPLIEVYDQVMGVKVYQVGKGNPKQTNYEIENNVFTSDKQDSIYTYPFVSQGIYRYKYESQNEFISYGEWLAEPRKPIYFDNPKVVIREIVNPRIYAAFFEEKCVVKNIAAVVIQKHSDFTLKYFLGIINSKLMSFYVNEQSPKSQNKSYPSFNSRLLKNIPIACSTRQQKDNLEFKVDLILKYENDFRIQTQKLSAYISSQYHIEKLSGKLSSWYELDFSDFIKELNKSIKTAKGTPLTKKDEFEWMELFEENKKKALALKAEIDRRDKEIDKMVYELYGLTEEEIRIVEGE